MDMSEKDEAWLDEPFYGHVLIPKLGKELKNESFGDLKALILDLVNDSEYHDSIISARDEYWQNRGNASKTVADYLLDKLSELKKT